MRPPLMEMSSIAAELAELLTLPGLEEGEEVPAQAERARLQPLQQQAMPRQTMAALAVQAEMQPPLVTPALFTEEEAVVHGGVQVLIEMAVPAPRDVFALHIVG